MCWLQKLDHTLHTTRRSFNQPSLSLWVLVYATKVQMAFRFNTMQFCTEVVLKPLQMARARCRGVKTRQLAVFLKRQTIEWLNSVAWGGHVWERRRTGMKVGRRDERWFGMRNQRSDTSYFFLSPTQWSKFCTINKLTQSLERRHLSKAKIKAKRGLWSPRCYFWFRLRSKDRVHLRSISLIEMETWF